MQRHCIFFVITSLLGCGGIMTATKGSIQSSSKDGFYNSNTNCTWKIQLTPGVVIKLNFSRFDLEQSSNCTKDYVLIKNGISVDSPVIGRYCGSQIPTNITSTGYELLIQFVTDGLINNRTGFELIYESVALGKKCYLFISVLCIIMFILLRSSLFLI